MVTANRRIRGWLPWAGGLALVLADLTMKRWVSDTLPYGRAAALWPGRLYLVWRTNTRYVAGAKRWGLSPLGNGLLLGTAALVILLVTVLYRRRAGPRVWARLAAAGFLGSLTSHLLDLSVNGGVVDWLWSPLRGGWAFNLADLALLAGSVCLAVEALISPLSPAAASRPAQGGTDRCI